MANSSKQPYIAFFEEYFNYMDDLNPEQYFQFMTLIRNLRWKGIDTLPENVTDKDVRLAWRSIRPSIAKSRRNASDFQNRNNSMEPNKDFEEEKPVDVPQESSITSEQPKNDLINEIKEKLLTTYENEFNQLVVKKIDGNDIMDDIMSLCYLATDNKEIVYELSNEFLNNINSIVKEVA